MLSLLNISFVFGSISNIFASHANYTTTEMVPYISNNLIQTTDLLFKLNEGTRLVYDYCEIVEPDEGIFRNEKKPTCLFNYSYFDSSDNIHVYKFNQNLRSYFTEKRTAFCKNQELMCGELTILIKLLDLINSVVNIILHENDHTNLWLNLEIIDFKNLYNLYISSIDNMEILTNITLRRQKSGIYLEREKTRLAKLLNKAYYEKFADNIYSSFGAPIYGIFKYVGSSIGNLFGEMVDGIMVGLSFEAKAILIIITTIIIKKI